MKTNAGLDVSLDSTAVFNLDLDGEIVCETSVMSRADDTFCLFAILGDVGMN